MGITGYGNLLPSNDFKLRLNDVRPSLQHAKDNDGDGVSTVYFPNLPPASLHLDKISLRTICVENIQNEVGQVCIYLHPLSRLFSANGRANWAVKRLVGVIVA